MEIEHPEQIPALKNNDLVRLVFEGNVLAGLEKVEAGLEVVHGLVPRVEEFVPEEGVVSEVVLAAGVVETIIVSCSRKVLFFTLLSIAMHKAKSKSNIPTTLDVQTHCP